MRPSELALSVPWQMRPERLTAMLEALDDEHEPPQALVMRPGRRREDLPGMTMRDGVVRIAIDGPLFRQADWFVRWFGGIATADLARQIQAAIDDATVSSILLAVDSPGGEATGIGELSDAIYQARDKKPLWAYVEGEGASAAYSLLSGAERVLIAKDAMVGSIGTVIGVPDPTRRPSYRIEFVSRQSPKKRPDPTTADGRAEFQQLADDMTSVFIERVARNRGLTPQAVEDVGGALLVGQKAIDAGLADAFGSEEQAIQELQAMSRGGNRRWPGTDIRQEEPAVKVFSREWWTELLAGANQAQGAPVEGQVLTAVNGIAPGQQIPGSPLPAVQLTQPLNLTPEQRAVIEAATAPLQAEQATQANAAADAVAKRIAELEQRLEAQRQQQIARDAAAFAQQAVRDHRAMPAEHDQLVALYVRAASDDHAAPVAEGQTSRIDQLSALVAARPQHTLSTEQIRAGAGGVLEDGAETRMSEGRRQALLAQTPLGQAVLTKTA